MNKPENTIREKQKKQKSIDNFIFRTNEYKILVELGENLMSRFASEKKNYFYIIPYDSEVKTLIAKAHKSNSYHYSARETYRQLNDVGIMLIGMLNRIEIELESCKCKLFVKKKIQKAS